jgi:hypothetical protein
MTDPTPPASDVTRMLDAIRWGDEAATDTQGNLPEFMHWLNEAQNRLVASQLQ